MDVSDPAHPRRLPFLTEDTGSTAEDVTAIAARTEFFSGDLLAAGLQSCREGGPHGAEFWDVTVATISISSARVRMRICSESSYQPAMLFSTNDRTNLLPKSQLLCQLSYAPGFGWSSPL